MRKTKQHPFVTLMFIVFMFCLFLVFAGESQAAETKLLKSGKYGCPGSYVQKVRPNGYLELRDTRYRLRNYNIGKEMTITDLDYYDSTGNFICSDPGLPITIGPNQSVSIQSEGCVPLGNANFQAIITWKSSGRGVPLEALWEIHVHDDNVADFEYRKTTARHSGKCTPLRYRH